MFLKPALGLNSPSFHDESCTNANGSISEAFSPPYLAGSTPDALTRCNAFNHPLRQLRRRGREMEPLYRRHGYDM